MPIFATKLQGVKRAIVSVTNDLSTDQRVHKTCMVLRERGFDVLLVGRKLPDSLELDRPYETHRMRLFFNKGFAFYAEYNFRLFVFLLIRRAQLLWSNDLDTLWPNFWVSRLKGEPLVYDTHEYFTCVPELESRPKVQAVWKRIEKNIFPRLNHVITVNQSIARLYEEEYGKSLTVVRNIPPRFDVKTANSRRDWDLPDEGTVFILQGSGINVDRGAEEAVEAMAQVETAHLVIIGGGDVLDILKSKVEELSLSDRVHFYPRMPYERMMQCTQICDVGLTLDKDTNINYRFSLPNKLFDYLQAGIAVIASGVVEVKRIVEKYELGAIIPSHNPSDIAWAMQRFVRNHEYLSACKAKAREAATELHWDHEKKNLTQIIDRFA